MIFSVGFSPSGQYSYLDKCNVAAMKPIEEKVMGISYDCKTNSTDFEKRTMARYTTDSKGRIVFLNPFYYEMLESDGSITKYSDIAEDGFNGNEEIITNTVPIPVLNSNSMRG